MLSFNLSLIFPLYTGIPFIKLRLRSEVSSFYMLYGPKARCWPQLHVHLYLSVPHIYISVFLTSISHIYISVFLTFIAHIYISGTPLPCPLGFYQDGIFGPVWSMLSLFELLHAYNRNKYISGKPDSMFKFLQQFSLISLIKQLTIDNI